MRQWKGGVCPFTGYFKTEIIFFFAFVTKLDVVGLKLLRCFGTFPSPTDVSAKQFTSL